MSRRLLITALILITTGVAPAVALDRVASAVEVTPAAVTTRCVFADGRQVGEVLIGGQVIFRIRAPLGTYTVEERTEAVAARLRTALADGVEPYYFGLDYCDRAVTLTAGGKHLVVVDRVTAAAAGGDPLSIGVIWLKNLRRALGWDPIADGRRQLASRDARAWRGTASWYGPGFQGLMTASGERFDMNDYTAAHRTLPFGARLLVTSLDTGLSVVVRVNDRGPFVAGREIDLSRAAASAIGLLGYGVGQVQIEVIR